MIALAFAAPTGELMSPEASAWKRCTGALGERGDDRPGPEDGRTGGQTVAGQPQTEKGSMIIV